MGFGIGNSVITTTQRIQGFRIGNTVIKAGGALTLDGFAIGNIVVEVGAVLILDGFLIGNLIDEGGDITINGCVIGNNVRTPSPAMKIADTSSNASNSSGRFTRARYLKR